MGFCKRASNITLSGPVEDVGGGKIILCENQASHEQDENNFVYGLKDESIDYIRKYGDHRF